MAGSNGPGEAVHATMDGSKMEVLAAGDPQTLTRPCIDCGLITGRFCDFCLAKDRFPMKCGVMDNTLPCAATVRTSTWQLTMVLAIAAVAWFGSPHPAHRN